MGRPKKCRASGKVKYKTHELALSRGGRSLEKHNTPNGLRAYICPHCNHYHLTSQPYENRNH